MKKEKLCKSVELNDDQYAELKELFDAQEGLTEALAVMLTKAISRQLKQERMMWDELARLAGFDDHKAVSEAGKRLRISWLRQCVDVYEQEEA